MAPVIGIDGSNWTEANGPTNWSAVKNQGVVRYVWWKATEGAGWRDPTYRGAVDGARAIGLPAGPYHFAHLVDDAGTPTDPAEQAAMFREWAPRADLPAALDVEARPGKPNWTNPAADTAWVLRWFDVVAEPFRVLYTNGDGLDHLDPAALVAGGVELWYANPNHDPATLGLDPDLWPAGPPGGGLGPIAAHQYSWTDSLDGFTGAIDLNAMSQANLDRYTYNPPPPDPGDDDEMRKPQTVLMDDGTLYAVDLNRTPPVRWHIPDEETRDTGAYMGWWEPAPPSPSAPNVQRVTARLATVDAPPYAQPAAAPPPAP